MKIAFLGLGQMGSAVAARLIGGDDSVTVWNRSKAAVEPLVQQGASSAESAGEAVREADVVFSMFTDDAATRAVILAGCIGSLRTGAVHVSLGTISVALAQELTQAHQKRQQGHVGSPVFGRPHVAADGKLWLAVGGEASLIERVKPLLDKFSRGTSVVGKEPWQAHALKLGGNFMITATIQMMAEAFVYAEAQGIDPAVFIETVNAALFQSQFVANYGKTMLHPPEKPGATVSLGIKDTRLFREASASKGIQSPLADYLSKVLSEAEAAGWKDEDWAVGQYRVAQRESRRG
jgi:3-hydroxyisobutyrate dehydrogenase-like beta-hydroxyacid dehydrogenase